MKCECGAPLLVIRIEEPPEHLSKQEKLLYDRLCDLECAECNRQYYSQPYDFGRKINEVKGNMKEVYSKDE
ncbi:hypothetical protein [Neobacillus niacini]|uniref:hypothetical protein n=1 Tax=Neobacillus niacini TaxID=86668 RepID=UPI0020423183|nr:hypothetical protein [Neobacillus niacini]MCM3692205.1 hypothetical protein [Neobacillus niacini]